MLRFIDIYPKLDVPYLKLQVISNEREDDPPIVLLCPYLWVFSILLKMKGLAI